MIVLIILFIGTTVCTFPSHCSDGWTYLPRLHTCLKVPNQPGTWEESRNYCIEEGGEMASIDSEEEYDIIRPFVAKENPKFLTWIALRYNANDEIFEWDGGRPLIRGNWLQGQPDTNNASCVALQSLQAKHGYHSLHCEYAQFCLCRQKAKGCQPRLFTESSGYVTTLNWPEEYPKDSDCYDYIEVPFGSKIKLWFENIDTEEGEDIMTIYDGRGEYSETLAKVSGQSFGRTLLSSSHVITLHFVSNSFGSNSGIRIQYTEWTSPEPIELSIARDESARLTSDNYPNGYSFTQQIYLISCSDESALKIMLTDINLHPKDRLVLYEQKLLKTQQKLLKRFTGIVQDVPITLSAQSGMVKLRFDGFNGVDRSGWALHYTCEAKEIEIP